MPAAATAKQIAANRQNAQLSHGPTSEEGLDAIALNNFRHGLATKTNAHFGMLMDENREAFDELHQSLLDDQKPEGETEWLLVRQMAESDWLRARALRFQAECMNSGVINVDPRKLGVFIRYQTSHERAFYKALKELQNIRKERRNIEIGIEAQKLKQQAGIRAAEAQNLKKQELEFKKEVFASKQEAQERRNGTPGTLKMAA